MDRNYDLQGVIFDNFFSLLLIGLSIGVPVTAVVSILNPAVNTQKSQVTICN